jgi:large subunit ribosomal protein L46
MDLWYVGRVPIGHYNYSHPKDYKSGSSVPVTGAKVCYTIRIGKALLIMMAFH